MTPSELKYQAEQTGSYFFTRSTMKFFGDTMRNYGVREARIETPSEEKIDVWELYRRHPVKHNLTDSAYFRKDTFERAYKRCDSQPYKNE